MPDGTVAPVNDLRVMLIEDDQSVAEVMRSFLRLADLPTAWAPTGAAALELKRSFNPSVVLVDLELPDTSGMALVRWLARLDDCGIIVVSGRGADHERVSLLELGADDYIAKPPNMRELVARIRAVHRRAVLRRVEKPAPASDPETPPHIVRAGAWTIDLMSRRVICEDGTVIGTTSAEFAALAELAASPGKPVSRERISETALRRPWRPEDRAVDQLILGLRTKLGDTRGGVRLIQSVRGTGYVIAPHSSASVEQPAHG